MTYACLLANREKVYFGDDLAGAVRFAATVNVPDALILTCVMAVPSIEDLREYHREQLSL
jgi:hypothetical protein